MTKREPVKVYLSSPQRELLEKIAKVEETSQSDVLRKAFIIYSHLQDKNRKLPG